MFLTVASFVITAALCYGIYHITMWHWRRRRVYKMASEFEGPSALPFIGNTHLLMGNSEQRLSKLHGLINSYPSPLRLWFGPILLFFVSDPEQIKTICINPKTLGKSKLMTDHSRPWLGTGLVTASVPKWKVHQKLIQPTFNRIILDSFVEAFAAHSKILIERMESYLDGPEFEIFNLISRCTLDMICETGMGANVEAQRDRNCYYVEAAQEVIAGGCRRMFSPWLYPDFIFYRTQIGRSQKKYIKYLHEFTANVIRLKKKQLLERQSKPVIADDDDHACRTTSQRKAFLDHLMTLRHDDVKLSDEELREEVDTVVLAGNDTSAVTSSYVMLMLASYPDIQEKVYRELFEIYGGDDIEERPVTPKDLPRMQYLERVIKETLRLFPVAPFILREVADDLKIGVQTLPKGSSVALGILPLHRNEKYWPDPLKFDPDRFLPEEIVKRHPYAFMAFSGGPRDCIGYKYALMGIKTLLGTTLRRYVLKKDNAVLAKDIRLTMQIVLRPAEPIKIRIER